MFIILRGCCSERLRPPPPTPLSEPGALATPPAEGKQSEGQGGPCWAAAVGQGLVGVGAWDVQGGGCGQVGAGGPPLRAAGGRRGATWEEAAFTEEEKRRLEAVRADLRAGRQKVWWWILLYDAGIMG